MNINEKRHIKSKLSVPFPRSYWIIPGRLLAGEFPGAKDPREADQKLKSLFGTGIRHVINLTEAHEIDHSGKPFVAYDNISAEFEKSEYDICLEVRRSQTLG